MPLEWILAPLRARRGRARPACLPDRWHRHSARRTTAFRRVTSHYKQKVILVVAEGKECVDLRTLRERWTVSGTNGSGSWTLPSHEVERGVGKR